MIDVFTIRGEIRQFDKDALSFTLRETEDGHDYVFHFCLSHYAYLLKAFRDGQRIEIIARKDPESGLLFVLKKNEC